MPQLARETPGSAQQPAVHDQRRADADLGRDMQEVLRGVVAEPQLGQRAEVGLVVHGQRESVGQQRAEVGVVPVEVGGADDGPGVAGHETGHGHREPRGPQALGRLGRPPGVSVRRVPRSPARGRGPGWLPCRTARARTSPRRSTAQTARWSTPTSAPIPAGPRPLTRERRTGTAHPAGPLGTQLLQEPGAYQLVHEGRHRGPGQTDAGGHRGTGQRPLGADSVHHPGQVAAAHALLGVGQRAPGTRPGGLVQRCGHASVSPHGRVSHGRRVSWAARSSSGAASESTPAILASAASSRSTGSSTGPAAVFQRRATAAGSSPVSRPAA